MNSRLMKNDGKDMAANTKNVTIPSNNEYCFMAESTPVRRAMVHVRNNASSTTINEFHTYLFSNEVTLS